MLSLFNRDWVASTFFSSRPPRIVWGGRTENRCKFPLESSGGVFRLPTRYSISQCHGQTVLQFDPRVLIIVKMLLPTMTLMRLLEAQYVPDISRLIPE